MYAIHESVGLEYQITTYKLINMLIKQSHLILWMITLGLAALPCACNVSHSNKASTRLDSSKDDAIDNKQVDGEDFSQRSRRDDTANNDMSIIEACTYRPANGFEAAEESRRDLVKASVIHISGRALRIDGMSRTRFIDSLAEYEGVADAAEIVNSWRAQMKWGVVKRKRIASLGECFIVTVTVPPLRTHNYTYCILSPVSGDSSFVFVWLENPMFIRVRNSDQFWNLGGYIYTRLLKGWFYIFAYYEGTMCVCYMTPAHVCDMSNGSRDEGGLYYENGQLSFANEDVDADGYMDLRFWGIKFVGEYANDEIGEYPDSFRRERMELVYYYDKKSEPGRPQFIAGNSNSSDSNPFPQKK